MVVRRAALLLLLGGSLLMCGFLVYSAGEQVSLEGFFLFFRGYSFNGNGLRRVAPAHGHDAVDLDVPPMSAPPKPEVWSELAGTPTDVTLEEDCSIRALAWSFGKTRLAWRGPNFVTLFDALKLSECPASQATRLPRGAKPDVWVPPKAGPSALSDEAPTEFFEALATPSTQLSRREEESPLTSRADDAPVEGAAIMILFVDSHKGSDSRFASGSESHPLATVPEALARVARSRVSRAEIILRAGTHEVPPGKPWKLTEQHSNLIIRNHPSETAIVTGAQQIKIPLSEWKRISGSAQANASIWVAQLPRGTLPFEGLRLNNKQRMVRAKHPNGAPEESGAHRAFDRADQLSGKQGVYTKGWFPSSTGQFIPRKPVPVAAPTKPEVPTHVSKSSDWPNVDWPNWPSPSSKSSPNASVFDPLPGMGGRGDFVTGDAANCAGLSPPSGYFCHPAIPRGKALSFGSPAGLARSPIPLAPGAVVVGWRGGDAAEHEGSPRWFNWVWRVAPQAKQESSGKGEQTYQFDERGGGQGAAGSDRVAEWYVENMASLVDEPGEWYFDETSYQLIMAFNSTSRGPTGKETWGLVRAKELIRVVGSSPQKAASKVVLSGLQFRDSALTWLEPHGTPGGGNVGLPRTGAIFAENVDGFRVTNCLFERLDGTAIMISGRARNVRVEKNEFAFLGASAVALWGRTSPCLNRDCSSKLKRLEDEGPDGRLGHQPQGTLITENLFRELGVFVKSSSGVFQALAGLSTISRNVFFNAPRSFLSFNDGYLGGDQVIGNLMVNGMRESDDQGSISAMHRMPFIRSKQDEPKDTTTPLTRTLKGNLILGTYTTQANVDTDDGASHFRMLSNVFVYGYYGLKNSFGGHNNEVSGNLFLHVGGACFIPFPLESSGSSNHARRADVKLALTFADNTCALRSKTNLSGYPSNCGYASAAGTADVDVRKNTIATRGDPSTLKACGSTLMKHLKQHGKHDPNTEVAAKYPSATAFHDKAQALLK